MTPTEDDADESCPYAEAIGQLLAAAQRTRDPEAWLTLTTLAEMFARLDQGRRQLGAECRAGLDRLYPPSGAADKPS
jgi:hypothetical protein